MTTTLGIHSNTVSGSVLSGHAWISVSRNGTIVYYGLWPDHHPRTKDNGAGSDIRVGMEALDTPAASRYYALTAAQEIKLSHELGLTVVWKKTHNCSSWASDVVRRVIGEDVDADDERVLGAETPVELGNSIRALELNNQTSRAIPRSAQAQNQRQSSSSW